MVLLQDFLFDITHLKVLHYGLITAMTVIGILVLQSLLRSTFFAIAYSPVLFVAALSGIVSLDKSGIAYKFQLSELEQVLMGGLIGMVLGFIIVILFSRALSKLA